MPILVISDIHANLNALDAVLADAGEVDATWCLGDLVGYGPDPNESVARVRGLPNLICLVGNHDAAALNQIDLYTFNPEARRSLVWTQERLTRESEEYLGNLPPRLVYSQVTLVHGSPRQPVWEYLLDTRTATKNFHYFKTLYCFVGHSHLPVIYQMLDGHTAADLIIPRPQAHFKMTPRAILNPGSVGQPRDRDPRAAYALYHPEEHIWEHRRVDYDISSVQDRMRQVGLPKRHIERLSAGW